MTTARQIWRTSENVMLTSYAINKRADIQRAFNGTGIEVRRVRFEELGLLAIVTTDNGIWLVFAIGTLTDAERGSWIAELYRTA